MYVRETPMKTEINVTTTHIGQCGNAIIIFPK